MRELKCNSCRNARPIISENGLHNICSLYGTKDLRCMANGDYYEHNVGPDDIAKSIAWKEVNT